MRKIQVTENYINMAFIIRTLHQILLGWSNQRASVRKTL